MNDQCPFPNLPCIQRYWSLAFAKHSSSLSFVPQEMSLNIDINKILPVNFSGVSPNLYSKICDFVAELQRIESCENIPLEFHWLTIDFVKRFCNFEKIVIHPNPFLSKLRWHSGFSMDLPNDTIQNPKRRRPFVR